MNVPGIVTSTLDGEEIAARVSLGGEDELFITPSSTLVYRAEGLLSDESVDEYPHGAERLTLSEGRRKTKFTLEYPLEGTREFTVPASKTDDVLHPVLAGVLNGNDITEPGETVVQTYRFSELTLIITSERLVKHIGSAVWDDDYEEYHFGDVTNLAFEDGSVATQIVLTVDGRPQRIKAPNEEANDLRERLKRALFDYHDVDSLETFNETIGGDDAGVDTGRSGASMDFGDGVDPLDADPPEPEDRERVDDAAATGTADPTAGDDPLGETSAAHEAGDPEPRGESHDEPASRSEPTSRSESASNDDTARESGQKAATVETQNLFEEAAESTADSEAWDADDSTSRTESTATPEPAPEVLERLETLEAAVERQNDLIEEQQRTIDQLITELRQGR
ncbi:DUF7115 domain-containing protein [Halopiger djelfimassiliensis]|uniref:DUF7115 domain-containing protein n=1 Tax=Halopiger djelfimassiliensis TaxID=1293047 RepID=UPI000677ACB3|nr:hypothetical protein [Halopiger djelfimassiliensis]